MWQKIKTSLPLNIVLIGVAAAVAVGAGRMARRVYLVGEEARETEARIGALEKKKAELEARVAELETVEGAEREAKARLNLKKPGEEVVVVVPEKMDEGQRPPATLWQKIKSFFEGIF